jgi:hypothetical protein
VAGLAGAAALSLIGSSVLIGQWSDAHAKLAVAGKFLMERGARHDRVMAYDPAALWAITGIPGVAPPYDLLPVIGKVIDAYDVRWVVVTLSPGQDRDPLDLWDGAAGTDSAGNRANFLPQLPAFSADGVRVYEVETSAR